MLQAKKDLVSRLQKDILQWQGCSSPSAAGTETVGLGAIEAAFPNGVFPVGALHELICVTPEQAAAAGGLLAGILSSLMQQGGTCLWISLSRSLFPPSLITFNVEPDRVIFIDVQREKEALWVMEEALKCGGLAAVVAEIPGINFAQSRRLQLAVESSRVTGFLLRNDLRRLSTTLCAARWQVTSLPSEPEAGLPGIGFPRWQVDLLRVRNGNPGSWKLEWEEGKFRPVIEMPVEINAERKAG